MVNALRSNSQIPILNLFYERWIKTKKTLGCERLYKTHCTDADSVVLKWELFKDIFAYCPRNTISEKIESHISCIGFTCRRKRCALSSFQKTIGVQMSSSYQDPCLQQAISEDTNSPICHLILRINKWILSVLI